MKTTELHIVQPDGSIQVTTHRSRQAAHTALASHLANHGGKGRAIMTIPGNPHALQPIEVYLP